MRSRDLVVVSRDLFVNFRDLLEIFNDHLLLHINRAHGLEERTFGHLLSCLFAYLAHSPSHRKVTTLSFGHSLSSLLSFGTSDPQHAPYVTENEIYVLAFFLE